ncbi:hypothetical protein DXV76_20955 [Rhodobacteraceae bacterium CCMM004]|nr:hypothetical protein DXV76_20955 [Rhodobacteraceae bacterium CCMM004]
MSADTWSGIGGDPFADKDDGTYRAWRSNAKGWVRDLQFVPAAGSDELTRFEPYMQAISIELNADGTALCLMCHTTGQIVFLEGRGLGELAEQISAKRVASIHVWSDGDGAQPPAVVTAMRFDKTASDLASRG